MKDFFAALSIASKSYQEIALEKSLRFLEMSLRFLEIYTSDQNMKGSFVSNFNDSTLNVLIGGVC